MSTVPVIIAIVILLGILVSYAFVQQTVKTKREQKDRLVSGLKAKARNFRFMLSGFPAGFLPKELVLLVQKSMVDVCEQLAKLEPKSPEHIQDLQLFSSQMAETQKTPKSNKTVSLQNPRQIQEVKACLEELHKFVHRMEERQTISKAQSSNYVNQIKTLVMQITIDSYAINAAQAEQNEKIKLAIHYYDLAINLIVREAKADTFGAKLSQFRSSAAALREKLSEQDAQNISVTSDPAEDEVQNEWDTMTEAQNSWKKKNVYD